MPARRVTPSLALSRGRVVQGPKFFSLIDPGAPCPPAGARL